MSNALLSIDMVTKESLRIAHEKAVFAGTTYREYDDSYAKKGFKIGDTLRIRNPNQYTRRQGSRVMDVQDQAESSQSLTVGTQDGVDMSFNSAELALTIDEFSDRYLTPAVSGLVSAIDSDYLAAMTKATYNVTGTAGTVVGTSGDISAVGLARAAIHRGLPPVGDDLSFQLDAITMATVVNAIKADFNPQKDTSAAFRDGYYGRFAGADWYENERTYIQTNGSDVTGTTDSTGLGTAAADGSYNTVDMHTTVAVATQAVGEVFTIAGIYQCHPETKQSTGQLQQFVITAIGASLTTVAPTIYLSGAKQNVCSSASAQLATTAFNSQTLTFVGAASTSYRHNLMYHREAFAFATADLPLYANENDCGRMTKDGLSLRVWKGPDIRNDQLLMRVDILYGWLAQRPAWACRVTN